jgi:hypothetical protein
LCVSCPKPPFRSFDNKNITHNSFKNLSKGNYFGKNTEKVEPLPGVELALIYPPCPLMISLAR